MGMSLAQQVAMLPTDVRDAWLASQPDEIIQEILLGEWWWTARPEQIPPPGDWLVCLALAGRGFGKSRSSSEWIVERLLQHPFDRHGVPTEHLVVADTLADARTINAEGPSGILNVLNRRKVDHRYKQSPRPMVLFPEGAKIYLEGADDPDTGRGYNAASIVCVARGEPVATQRGPVSIEHVTVHDHVRTSRGWQRVLRHRLTKTEVSVVEVVTTSGSVRLTSDHLVWTRRGWIDAGQLLPGDSLLTCLHEMNQLTPYPRKHQHSMNGMEKSGTSTRGPVTTITETVSFSIEQSGSPLMVQSLRGMKLTISIDNDGTRRSLTSNSSQFLHTGDLVPWSAKILDGGSSNSHGLSVPVCWPTGNVVDKSHRRHTHAMSVDPSLRVGECVLSAALSNAEPSIIDTLQETTVVTVRPGGVSDVFDLTVENASEFCAGTGFIKIHNCDEMAKWVKPYETWYEGLLPSLRADLMSDHPRAFVTTTPKPIKLLIEWLARQDHTIHVITGSTFDNAANLSAHALRELKLRYDGTSLGEQELYGKLLELMGGGLFKRMDIVKNRVTELPDKVVSTVVGVDPNLTGEDAETGIVVVCRTADNHMYVLGDRTVQHSGRAAAMAIWRTVAEFAADIAIYEENLGKRYLQEVLQDAYQECVEQGLFPRGSTPPMKAIHAKHGKKTRAEPVAMRGEQGKLHIVGELEELENQMVLFDPESTRESPDRMDAMVHGCLHLMAGEKRRMGIGDPSRHDFVMDQAVYDLSRLL